MDWLRVSEQGCQHAERVITDRIDRSMWRQAMQYLSRCGESGGRALARELRTVSAISDTVVLNDVVRESIRIRDASVLAAATELASDPAATLEARIAGLRVVVSQAHPGYRTWFRDYMLSNKLPGGTIGPASHERGAELPTGWKERTDSALTRIMEDPGESEAMQWAANRALLYLRALSDTSGAR